MSLHLVSTAIILCAASFALPAQAAPNWSPHDTGIEFADYMEGNTHVYATKVDLCAPGISMRATAPGEGPRRPSSFGQLVGASVAINGDWWSNDGEPHLPSTYPRGLGIGNGTHFPGTIDRPNYGVVAFGPSITMHSVMEDDLGGPHWWMQEAVSGQPTLVWDGQLRNNPNAHCGVRRARTAIGFNEEKSVMYMAVVQEVAGSTGMTCNEMGTLMQSMGAHSALNQDGGGSSTMYLEGVGVVNRPSDGQERNLVNHWGVMASSWGPPRHCMARDLATPTSGVRRLVAQPVSDAWNFENTDVAFMSADTLDEYVEGPPLAAPRFIQHSDSSLWLIDNGVRRHVQTFYAIMTWRIASEGIEQNLDAELESYPVGTPLRETPDLFLGEGGAIWLLDTAALEDEDDGDGAGNDAGPDTDVDDGTQDETPGSRPDESAGGCSVENRSSGSFPLWPLLLGMLAIFERRRLRRRG